MSTKKNQPSKQGSNPTGTPSPATPLQELFNDGLRDIYWAENHLVKNLPKMKKSATAKALQDAIAQHIEVTRGHVARLEKIFKLLNQKATAKKCDAMDGLAQEGEGIIEDTEPGTATRDIGIIMASRKVEHYEIATYHGLAGLAATLGYKDVSDLLNKTLTEEQESDDTLRMLCDTLAKQAKTEKNTKPL